MIELSETEKADALAAAIISKAEAEGKLGELIVEVEKRRAARLERERSIAIKVRLLQ